MLGILIGNAVNVSRPSVEIRIGLAMTPQGPRIQIHENSAGGNPVFHARTALDTAASPEHDAMLHLSIAWAVARSHDFAIHLDASAFAPQVTIDCWPQMSFGL